jgi:hypothetical protein
MAISNEHLFVNQNKLTIRLRPFTEDEAIGFWRQSDMTLTSEQLGDHRILPGSPMNCLLHILRREVSALPSSEVSDIGVFVSDDEASEQNLEEQINEKVEILRREVPRRVDEAMRAQGRGRMRVNTGAEAEAEAAAEAEAKAEGEPDTEHELDPDTFEAKVLMVRL